MSTYSADNVKGIIILPVLAKVGRSVVLRERKATEFEMNCGMYLLVNMTNWLSKLLLLLMASGTGPFSFSLLARRSIGKVQNGTCLHNRQISCIFMIFHVKHGTK